MITKDQQIRFDHENKRLTDELNERLKEYPSEESVRRINETTDKIKKLWEDYKNDNR